MKKIITLMLFLTFFAHANDSEPGSQYLKAAEAGDRRAQYFLADSWFSSGDLSKAE
ncbi:sel1 repeat family protein, partial [Escherichia coli]